jgi:hypothetical protein
MEIETQGTSKVSGEGEGTSRKAIARTASPNRPATTRGKGGGERWMRRKLRFFPARLINE